MEARDEGRSMCLPLMVFVCLSSIHFSCNHDLGFAGQGREVREPSRTVLRGVRGHKDGGKGQKQVVGGSDLRQDVIKANEKGWGEVTSPFVAKSEDKEEKNDGVMPPNTHQLPKLVDDDEQSALPLIGLEEENDSDDVDAFKGCFEKKDVEAVLSGKRKQCGAGSNFTFIQPMDFSKRQRDLMTNMVSQSSTYFEWGGGGTTNTVAFLASQLAVTVEHNPPWCSVLSSNPIIAERVRRGKSQIRCFTPSNISLDSYGHPFCRKEPGLECAEHFNDYVSAIETVSKEQNGDIKFDIVFVDGHMRVACALRAIPFLRKGKGTRSRVVVHDYGRYRKHLLKFFSETVSTELLGVLVPREDVEINSTAWRAFMTNEHII